MRALGVLFASLCLFVSVSASAVIIDAYTTLNLANTFTDVDVSSGPDTLSVDGNSADRTGASSGVTNGGTVSFTGTDGLLTIAPEQGVTFDVALNYDFGFGNLVDLTPGATAFELVGTLSGQTEIQDVTVSVFDGGTTTSASATSLPSGPGAFTISVLFADFDLPFLVPFANQINMSVTVFEPGIPGTFTASAFQTNASAAPEPALLGVVLLGAAFAASRWRPSR